MERRMPWRRASLVLCAALAACTQRTTTDELRETIAAYERADAGATEDRIAALFAKLDAEVAALKAEELAKPADAREEVAARREALVAERRGLQTAYLQARVKRLGVAADDALKGLGDQLGQSLEEAGRALRESMRRDGAPREGAP
jgi:hypothetical protein